MRQKVGAWGENTFLAHFKAHPEYGLSAFPYGEAYSGRGKAKGDAVCRPDLLIIETCQVEAIQAEGIPLVSAIDLRKLPDDDPVMVKVLAASLVAVEVKFSHRKYVAGHVKFIIDEGRRSRYEQWLSRTRGVGALTVWLTTDRAWIAPTEKVLRDGKEEERTYEMRGGAGRKKKTWNLPVESAQPFASVTGYELNKTFKASLRWTVSGGIEFDVTDDLGDFSDVQVATLRSLAKSVRRP